MSSVPIRGRKNDGYASLIFCLVVSEGADGFRTAQSLGTQMKPRKKASIS
jgi:hypothetical protein